MFNLWKTIKNAIVTKTASREQDLEKLREDGDLKPMDGDSIPYALSQSHGDAPDRSVASMLEEDRVDEVDQVVEARLGSKSAEDRGLVSWQDREDRPISDINLASEGWDSKFREAYAAAKRGERDLFSLHFDPSKPLVKAVPDADSGIANRPGRITDYGGIPLDDAKENLKNIGKQPVVKAARAELLDIDRRAFEIRVAAAMDGRQLSSHESEELAGLSSRKRALVEVCLSDIGGL
jgi:hypothetical protein